MYIKLIKSLSPFSDLLFSYALYEIIEILYCTVLAYYNKCPLLASQDI